MNSPYPRHQPNIIGNFTHAPEWMTEAVCAEIGRRLGFPRQTIRHHALHRVAS